MISIVVFWLQVVSKFDPSSNQAIQKTLDALNSNTVCQHLAFIKLHFECLPKLINRLEKQGMKLCEAVNEVVGFKKNASSWPGEIGKSVRMKLETVLEKNPGWNIVIEFSKMLNGEMSTLQHEYSPGEIAALHFLPIVSCDVERSFSMLKSLLSDNRRRLTPENLEQHIIVQFNDV